MADNAFKKLLDRDRAKVEAKFGLGNDISLLKDLIDYGTCQLVRCYDSSKKDIVSIVVLPALFRHALSMLDGVAELLESGAGYSARLQARSFWETTLYIDWILDADSETRASLYYVCYLRQRKLWASRFTAGTKEHLDFTNDQVMAQYCHQIAINNQNQIREDLNNIQTTFNLPKWGKINKLFEQLVKKTRYEPKWYEPAGISSVAKMARALNRHREYISTYYQWSLAMHGSSFGDQLLIHDSKLHIEPLRSITKGQELVGLVEGFMIRTIYNLLKKFRPDEEVLAKQKYLQEWRQRFINKTI